KWQSLLPEFNFPQSNGFYFFTKDEKTGLNSEIPAPRTSKPKRSPVFGLSRFADATMFNPKNFVFKTLQPMAKSLDKTRVCKHIIEDCEHMTKVVLFDCQNCGDCGLFDVAFLCPVSQCPKNQRNGPCGGSLNGWCEVFPKQRQCIWVRAYDRLKLHHKEESNTETIIPPNDWTLQNTSSWLNFYCGRDHTAKRMGIKPTLKDKQ
ncbi:MAG TPA: methylenetetrahydrofolate reductase C-terminal domain-containing protein, partial [Dehalococcoidales bacterium]|nr:methylenetetrahydrofolate reductase C-terminal domain-containing protein [Dehalococcoidales bacterium]